MSETLAGSGLRVIIFLVLFCHIPILKAQENTRSIGGQFSYQAQDFFFGLHVASQHRRLEHKLQLQVGVRTTFFQQRIFPQISYQFTWYPVNLSWFRAGVFIRPVFAEVNAKKDSSNGYVFYEELLPGLGLSFGKKHRISTSFMYGPFYEQRFSSLNNAYNPFFAWTFNAEISYAYAF